MSVGFCIKSLSCFWLLMLSAEPTYLPPDARDVEIFQATVPPDHYLRRVKAVIDFDRLRPLLADAYCPDQGRPAREPLLLLKLEFLQYRYNLSDRQVIDHAQSHMAYRYFLDLSLHSPLPHPSLLTYFRQRLGLQRHQQVFDALVGQARERGLVKDRLRLKDATHVLANIAIPSTIALVAQTRDRLLQALQPWAAAEVSRQRQRAEQIRQSTADLSGAERLLQRVVHLREVVAWAQVVSADPALTAGWPGQQQQLQQALTLACQILEDRDDPDGKSPLCSVQDPDARSAKHGSFYVGYLVDVALDADSQLITALNVLPGGANEGADAETLLRCEEAAHGNDVQALSLDGAGFQGPVLRALTDPAGLQVEVFVPPKAPIGPQEFQPEQFTLAADQQSVRCPAGQRATNRRRHAAAGWQFRFARATCAACPLRSSCVPQLPKTTGRTVFKSDYEQEFQAARAKVQTPAYEQVRREHPAIERKLGELVRRHGARRARYWGRARVLVQQLLTGWVVNIKRVVKLLLAPPEGQAGIPRAGILATG
jgi:transposase